jgi:hypothetical protein
MAHSDFLQLEETDESKAVIAKFHERHYGIFAKHRQAYLDVFDDGKQFMDQIIFTFMYVSLVHVISELVTHLLSRFLGTWRSYVVIDYMPPVRAEEVREGQVIFNGFVLCSL